MHIILKIIVINIELEINNIDAVAEYKEVGIFSVLKYAFQLNFLV